MTTEIRRQDVSERIAAAAAIQDLCTIYNNRPGCQYLYGGGKFVFLARHDDQSYGPTVMIFDSQGDYPFFIDESGEARNIESITLNEQELNSASIKVGQRITLTNDVRTLVQQSLAQFKMQNMIELDETPEVQPDSSYRPDPLHWPDHASPRSLDLSHAIENLQLCYPSMGKSTATHYAHFLFGAYFDYFNGMTAEQNTHWLAAFERISQETDGITGGLINDYYKHQSALRLPGGPVFGFSLSKEGQPPPFSINPIPILHAPFARNQTYPIGTTDDALMSLIPTALPWISVLRIPKQSFRYHRKFLEQTAMRPLYSAHRKFTDVHIPVMWDIGFDRLFRSIMISNNLRRRDALYYLNSLGPGSSEDECALAAQDWWGHAIHAYEFGRVNHDAQQPWPPDIKEAASTPTIIMPGRPFSHVQGVSPRDLASYGVSPYVNTGHPITRLQQSRNGLNNESAFSKIRKAIDGMSYGVHMPDYPLRTLMALHYYYMASRSTEDILKVLRDAPS